MLIRCVCKCVSVCLCLRVGRGRGGEGEGEGERREWGGERAGNARSTIDSARFNYN